MFLLFLLSCLEGATDTKDTGSVRYLVSTEDHLCPASGSLGIPLDGRTPLQVFSLDVQETATLWDGWKYNDSTLAIWCPDTGAVRVVWGGGL